jgi:hypothetical protein
MAWDEDRADGLGLPKVLARGGGRGDRVADALVRSSGQIAQALAPPGRGARWRKDILTLKRVGCVNSIALPIARFRGPTEFAHPTGGSGCSNGV